MKKIILLIFAAAISYSFMLMDGKDGIIFKAVLLPNSVYNITFDSDVTSDVDFKGSPEVIDQMKNRGVKIPIAMLMKISMNGRITTGDMKIDSTFPFETEIIANKTTGTINGEAMPLPDKFPLKNLKVSGIYTKDNLMTNLEVQGDSLSEEIKNLMIKTTEDLMKNIKFPEKPLSIGDSFQQEIPMQMPILQGMIIDMKTIITYTLEKVESEKAYFNTVTTIELNSNNDKYKITATGGGNGFVIHDLKRNYISSSDTDLSISCTVDMGQFQVISTTKSKSVMKID